MRTPSHFLDRQKEADSIIKRYTLIAAGTGFVPIPLLDAAAMMGVQFNMIRQLAFLYDTPLKGHRSKAVGAAFMGSVGTISGFKFIPKIGTVLGGLTSSTIGAASTYAIGKVFAQHFDQGGTLLDFDPLVSREHFEKELEKGKEVIAQLRAQKALENPVEQQKAVQYLLADSDQYLAILAELQSTVNQYKSQPSGSKSLSKIIPTIVQEDNIEETKVVLSPQKDQAVLTASQEESIEKLNWWDRLKKWLERKRYK